MQYIKSVRWDITRNCNLNCFHCQASIYKETKLSNHDLDFNEVCNLIDQLKELGVKSIGLLGGELLARTDIINILKYINKNGIYTTLNTNGLLINNFNINDLLSSSDTILVSLDGTNSIDHDKLRGKGTFELATGNVKKMLKYRDNTIIGISYVLNKFNINSINEIPEFIKRIGVDYISIDVVHRTGNADLYWNKVGLTDEDVFNASKLLAKAINKNPDLDMRLRQVTNRVRDLILKETGFKLPDKFVCEAPARSSLFISNDGMILPSQFFAYIDNNFKTNSCDSKKYKIKDIIKNEEFREFNNLYKQQLYLKYYEPCRKCLYSGKQCNPSPISYYFNNKIPVSLCLYAYNRSL